MKARAALAGVAVALLVQAAFADAPPWRTWEDLRRLAELHPGHQALLRSSYCPGGCRFDRHSAGDWRYLYVDGDEGVIFEEVGPGAITRIWMTMGFGVSEPLDPEIRLRVYVDGGAVPVVDLPLPALFDGSTPPFVPPLVGNRLTSSGGNFSYVPIPYRQGCRVALVGADDKRLWFQFGFHRLADADGVTSFTGTEDLGGLSGLLASAGDDPWPPGSGAWTEGTASLDPAAEERIVLLDEPGAVTGLELTLDPAHWPGVEIRLAFDGEETARMPLADFFAVGRVGSLPTRSLFVGLGAAGELYSFFPMPFFDGAEITLANLGAAAAAVAWRVRLDDRAPPPRSGLFGAALAVSEATPVGVDFSLVSLTGEGRVAGAFFELGSTGSPLRDYLEGDERMFVDGSPHPGLYGTGVEDFFNGGFYFDQGPFSLPLHGAPYTELMDGGLPLTAAYRLMLTDGVTFASRLEAGLEGGPTSNVSMRARAVTYFYRRRAPRLLPWDVLDVGVASDRRRHRFAVEGPHAFEPLDGLFEGEPPAAADGIGVYRPPGSVELVMRAPAGAERLRLRRRLDAVFGGQRATIFAGGLPVGEFPPVDVHTARRWQEVDVDLGPDAAGPEALTLRITAAGGAASEPPEETFTAFRYELWVDAASALCPDADGDGVCDGLDDCPGFDDAADADGDAIPDGCDACPEGLTLPAQQVASAVVYESCDWIAAGGGFEVVAPGFVALRAASLVSLDSGFSVLAGSTLEIEIDPALAAGLQSSPPSAREARSP